ncbi:MAG: aminotransferase class V-fold PLP-dependent enzyme [Anaerolineales bacterium]|nr:aminotransferase class V-fold PLP-dependent enzyme [Anaerolineales bacterium]
MPDIEFLLDPTIIFLNHGSFGATPRPVFDVYQNWQQRLERRPVEFLARELDSHYQQARDVLGAYLNADPDDLVFVPNATFAVNMIARSLQLEPGDVVLGTNHEYGACEFTWEFVCNKRMAHFVRQPIPMPAGSSGEIVERFWEGVTPDTRVIFLSHITSPTALKLPVKEICEKAREAGILTVIDGAHAPGQIDLDLDDIGVDFYTGNLHKWFMSPKGAAFLYTRRDRQPLIEPLVVSWGWGSEKPDRSSSRYVEMLQWWGTIDPAAALSAPAAIRFQQEHDWPAVRQRCHQLVRQAMERVCALTSLPPLYRPESDLYCQMASILLPRLNDLVGFQAQLYDRFRIEIPLIEWNSRHLIRVSIQGYNSQRDVDCLIDALDILLPKTIER